MRRAYTANAADTADGFGPGWEAPRREARAAGIAKLIDVVLVFELVSLAEDVVRDGARDRLRADAAIGPDRRGRRASGKDERGHAPSEGRRRILIFAAREMGVSRRRQETRQARRLGTSGRNRPDKKVRSQPCLPNPPSDIHPIR